MKEVIKLVQPKPNNALGQQPNHLSRPLYQFDIEREDALLNFHFFLQGVVGELIDTCYVPTDGALFEESKVTNYTLRVWVEPGYYIEADVQLGFKQIKKAKGTPQPFGLELDCYWDYPFEQEHALRLQSILTDRAYWFEILTAMHSTLVTNLTNCLLSEVATI